MSLIVATSRIDENTLPQASEKPSNFKNFFRSPIEIEADSEIAVQSVKVQRTGNITIEEDDFFCHYFGIDPRDYQKYTELTSFSRTIKIPRGTYSLSGYEKQVQDALNLQYDDPRTFGGYGVDIHTNASGEELGLDIQCVDKGSATGKDFHASLGSTPTYNIANPYSYWEDDEIEKSSKFTWTPATGIFLSTEESTTLNNSESIGMLTGFPFGLNGGKFIVETAVAMATDDPLCIGLSRPQIQIESDTNATLAQTEDQRWRGIEQLDDKTYPAEQNQTKWKTYNDEAEIEGTWEMYDYVFAVDDEDEITIAQRVWNEDQGVSQMQEIDYWNNAYTNSPGTAKLTKAQFVATWDGIQFVGVGDEVELYFKEKGKAVFNKVVSSSFAVGAPGTCFSPIGSACYALYPQLNIGDGSVHITKYDSSNTLNQYKFPVFTVGATGGYLAGDDAFSNEGFYGLSAEPYILGTGRTLCSTTIQSFVFTADSSFQKLPINELPGDYIFALLNSGKGVDYTHLFTMNKFTPPERLDTLFPSQEYPNMSGKLGFVDRAFIISNNTDGYVTGNDTLTVIFTSTGQLQKTATGSFIRIPNLTHRTFNGAQSGISKIIYQLPQFANDGRQFGALYFEASEKTYVKLHNTAPMILNMLQVQIVDAQERELNSLTGDTQVVFHVRKAV
tara:strand:- start:1398 stop:3413 length:2016 start_codon:yes stop_codon:yes gene_type:complete